MVDSVGCNPLRIGVQADSYGVSERVRTLLQSAPDAALMTDMRILAPLHSTFFWF